MPTITFAGGTLIDATGGPPSENAVLIVEDGRIKTAGKRSDFPQDLPGRVVDCTGKSCLPGMINSHLHLALDGDDESYVTKLPRLAQMTDRELVPLYADQAKKNLMSGITTVRDLHPGPGGTTEGMLVVKQLLNRGYLPGSRVYLALRPLAMAGGHGTQWLSRVASGVEEVRRATRENVAEGSDFIKIMTAHSWGPLPNKPETQKRYFLPEELAACVGAAHRAGLPVSAHSHGHESISDNLDAGIDSIEHGSGLTDQLIERMVEKGTFLVPTVRSYQNFVEVGEARGVGAERVADARYVAERQQSGLRKAIQAGVKIAAGTDAGFQFLPHGSTFIDELLLYGSLGMDPYDVIRSATIRGAELLQLSDRLGTIEPGKLADVIVVDGNPLEDLALLSNVSLVMKEGVLYKEPKHVPSEEAAIL